MIFVDTSGWFASIVPSDPNHGDAVRWVTQARRSLFTTDYVIDETLTVLLARGEKRRAVQLGKRLFESGAVQVHFLTSQEIRSAWQIFRDFTDKQWSFTDCTSKLIIEQFGLTHAFSFDEHFRQFGSVVVVP